MSYQNLLRIADEIKQKANENLQYIEETKELFSQFCENADNVTYDDVSSRVSSVFTCLTALDKTIEYFYQQASHKQCPDERKHVAMAKDQLQIMFDEYHSLRNELKAMVRTVKELV